jgi:DNA-binding response OmpR family regulator
VHVGRLSIDVPHRRAQWGGQPLALSAKEFGLLLELASDPGAVRTKRDLLYRVWEFPGSVRTRTVDSHASRLRRKLIAAGAPRELVQNVWGEGYRLEVGRG